jgi:hypothetical protein
VPPGPDSSRRDPKATRARPDAELQPRHIRHALCHVPRLTSARPAAATLYPADGCTADARGPCNLGLRRLWIGSIQLQHRRALFCRQPRMPHCLASGCQWDVSLIRHTPNRRIAPCAFAGPRNG